MSKYNDEHYRDSTAQWALRHVMREERMADLPMVYIAAAYEGNVIRNIRKAQEYCHVALDRWYLPIAPCLYLTQLLDAKKTVESDLIATISARLQKQCEELWVCGDVITAEMDDAIKRAKLNDQVIKFFDENMEEVRRDEV